MRKEILHRIFKLEKLLPAKDYNEEEYIQEFVQNLEKILNCKINERINLKEIDYTNKDTIERSIFKFLTLEELRYIAYWNC